MYPQEKEDKKENERQNVFFICVFLFSTILVYSGLFVSYIFYIKREALFVYILIMVYF